VKRSYPPEFQALSPALYRFPITKSALRQHCLASNLQIDTNPRRPSSKKLILDLEEQFMKVQEGTWHSRTRRLKGFRGDYYWKNGLLRFWVRSPEIPFFGLDASRLCKDLPIVYWSRPIEGPETAKRYFYAGYELSVLPRELRGPFARVARVIETNGNPDALPI
jgi:hypothetical protein